MTDIQPQDRIITVFGGSGFLGRHLVRALARDGWRIRVATRRPDLAFHLQPLGRVGQINAVQANVRYPDSLAAALRGAEAAVNLVGILAPWGKQTFDTVQSEGAGRRRQGRRARPEFPISSMSRRSAPTRPRIRPMRAARRKAKRRSSPRCPTPRSCAPRSCSAPRTSSSTVSPPWRASPRPCR